jgi:XTP/dITP diphosphohydrolase
MTDLLLATDNPGKLVELRALLPVDITVGSLADVGLAAPEETGKTISENSSIKAVVAARASGMLTLADDSGLEVDALGGLPGARSKRFANESGDAEANITHLLDLLRDKPPDLRTASFLTVLTLANSDGVLASSSGRLHGQIGFVRKGANGFGYDPIFCIEDGRTIAELDPDEKNQISHRGQALREILPGLLIAIGTYRFSTHGAGQ